MVATILVKRGSHVLPSIPRSSPRIVEAGRSNFVVMAERSEVDERVREGERRGEERIERATGAAAKRNMMIVVVVVWLGENEASANEDE